MNKDKFKKIVTEEEEEEEGKWGEVKLNKKTLVYGWQGKICKKKTQKYSLKVLGEK